MENVMDSKKMLMGNLNCVFNGAEPKGFFHLWHEFTHSVFEDGIEYPPEGIPRYTFMNVKQVQNLAGEAAIIGKFVKITILDVSQEYHNGILINVEKHFNSAPSSIFVYLIRSHTLLFLNEHKGSPSITQFIRYFKTRVETERSQYVSLLLKGEPNDKLLREKYPPAQIDYTGIVSTTRLRDLFNQTKSISDLHISTTLQNGDMIIDGLIGNQQEAIKMLRAARADTKFSYVKSVEGAEEVVSEVIKNGSADFKFKANLDDGSKKYISNSSVRLESEVQIPQESTTENSAKIIIEHFHNLQSKKEIPEIVSTNADEVISEVFNDEQSKE